MGWIWNSVQLLLAVAVLELNGNPSTTSFFHPQQNSIHATKEQNIEQQQQKEPQSTQQGNFPTMITLFLHSFIFSIQLYTIIEEFIYILF